ncbi:hypothetical protein C8Q78DRAFT_994255 [Trametes maxima]|nr:hypothetical protein C8Q78DRAFT_994255 [Trametes maxima]
MPLRVAESAILIPSSDSVHRLCPRCLLAKFRVTHVLYYFSFVSESGSALCNPPHVLVPAGPFGVHVGRVRRLLHRAAQQSQQQQGTASPFGGFQLQPDNEPLPDVTDASIFQAGWTGTFNDAPTGTFDGGAPFDPHYRNSFQHQHAGLPPLDSFDFASASTRSATTGDRYAAAAAVTPRLYKPIDPHAAWPAVESGPSSAFSGSLVRSDVALPPHANPSSSSEGICVPQPQHAAYSAWTAQEQPEHAARHEHHMSEFAHELEKGYGYDMCGDLAMGFNAGIDTGDMGMGVDMGIAADYVFCAAPEY